MRRKSVTQSNHYMTTLCLEEHMCRYLNILGRMASWRTCPSSSEDSCCLSLFPRVLSVWLTVVMHCRLNEPIKCFPDGKGIWIFRVPKCFPQRCMECHKTLCVCVSVRLWLGGNRFWWMQRPGSQQCVWHIIGPTRQPDLLSQQPLVRICLWKSPVIVIYDTTLVVLWFNQ